MSNINGGDYIAPIMNTNVEAARTAIAEAARAMIAGTILPIEGCRRICRLRFDAGDQDNPMFLALRGVDSETDHFPLGESRSQYSPEYLEALDQELSRYLASARDDIARACLQIVEAYSLP